MNTVESLFESFVEMRLSGVDVESANRRMQDEIFRRLNRDERQLFRGKCERWENERTQVNLNEAQQEALRRSALTNITIKITFCPICDSPNSGGFINCQVCDAPLEIKHSTKLDGTSAPSSGANHFSPQHSLVMTVLSNNQLLCLQPQVRRGGLRLGRASGPNPVDIDLTSYDAAAYGVSREHARIRFDSEHKRLLIQDLGSTNGTYVNGFKLPAHREATISNGDEIRLAKMQMRIAFKVIATN